MLLNGPARMPRERLATNLWPDEIESDGRTKLRRMVYLIGQAAPEAGSDDWLVTDTTTIGWNPEIPRIVDVEALREALAAPEPIDTSHLYAGDLLADFDDEWILAERDRLRDRHIGNLERLAKAHAKCGRHAEARDITLEMLRLEPWREDAMRFALEMRVAVGDRAGALAEYDRFEQRLREELGVDPMPETIALRARLLRGVPAPVAPPPSPPLRIATRGGDGVFVGRERELAMLADRFAEAERGSGGLVLVGGESGMGKSELLARHARTATDRGGIVLSAGSTFVATRPYQPFATALGAAQRLLSAGEFTQAMQAAFDRLVLGAALPVESSVPVESESVEDRKRLFGSVVSVFERIAQDRPVVLVLEDLHWANSDTVALLEYLARRASQLPILILGTFRDGEVPRAHPLRAMRRRLQEEGLVATIALGPLQDREVQRYLELVHGAATPDVAERYTRASQGLPLVLAGLAADASAASAPTEPIASPRHVAPEKIPALASRVDALPPEALSLLEIAAVVGFGFDVELVVEVSGWSEAEVNHALSISLGRRILRESPTGGYDFAHDLFREIVYDAMPPTKRARRHALVADVLQQLHTGSVDALSAELAMHYERAGDIERAIPALARAAARAQAASAHEDAAQYATRALDLGAAGLVAIELLLVRESVMEFTGDRVKQRKDLEACEVLLATPGVPPSVEADIFCRFVTLETVTSRLDAAQRAADRAEVPARTAGGAWTARLEDLRGTLRLEEDAYDEARAHYVESARIYREIGATEGEFRAAVALASIARLLTDFDQFEIHLAFAESLLPALGERPDLTVRLFGQRTYLASSQQRFAEAAIWAQRMLDVVLENGSVSEVASAYMSKGAYAMRLNEFELARQCFARSGELFGVTGDRQYAAMIRWCDCTLEECVGDFEGSIASGKLALDEFRELGIPFYEGVCLDQLCRTFLYFERFEESLEAGKAATAVWARVGSESNRAMSVVRSAIALSAAGGAAEAVPILRTEFAVLERSNRPRDLIETLAAVAHAEAKLGRHEEARAAAIETLRRYAEIPESYRPLQSYAALIKTYQLTGDARAERDTALEAERLLDLQASSIEDASWRAGFLAKPALRFIREARLASPSGARV